MNVPLVAPLDAHGTGRAAVAPAKRILLVRHGDFFFYVHQLALLLTRAGHQVEILNCHSGPPEPLYVELVEDAERNGVACHLVIEPPPVLERKLTSLAARLSLFRKRAVVTPFKVRRARKIVRALGDFDLIIAYDPASLFLAAQLFPDQLGDIINYSLEAIDETHPDFQTSKSTRSLRRFERRVQHRLRGLLVQDPFRAELILRRCHARDGLRTIYLPVCMQGGATPAANAEHEPREGRASIVFYGALWRSPLVDELRSVARRLPPGQRIVVRGGRGTLRAPEEQSENFVLSNQPLAFGEINDFIRSGHIGLALYPDHDANSRHTAFASEKIARYTQCGLPFIAFSNPDYAWLRSRHLCCELVEDYAELPAAIARIVERYGEYRAGALQAFERFYSLEATSRQLLREVSGLDASDDAAGPFAA